MNFTKSSRTLIASATVALAAFTLSAPASATFSFSDVTHTANSITFTIDGDMSGYAIPWNPSQFSIRMPGNIYVGPADGFTANNWSASPFDNKVILGGGMGNLYDDTGTVPYSWTPFSGSLGDAFATMNTVTVSWSENWLDPEATNTTLEFVWGNGNDMSIFTLLAPDGKDDGGSVAEPTSLTLLGLGLAGLGWRRRQQKTA